jgi:ribonucleoside-diphosphate reductase alpha chain
VTAFAGAPARGSIAGTAALKAEAVAEPRTRAESEARRIVETRQGTALESLPWSQAEARAAAAERRAEAKAKGYEGEACAECGNFTLVRNGTCLKCDTCGSTTGCS